MNSISVGIDVSKGLLVSSINQAKPFELANSLQGSRTLASMLPEGSIVHLEATGGFERQVRKTLMESGFTVRVHNPCNARRMNQALSVRAKTDPVDAVSLSRSGHLLPEREPKSVEREMLADHSRAIEAISETIADFKRRLKQPNLDDVAATAYLKVVDDLTQRKLELKDSFAQRILNSSLREQYKLAQSLPGIGAYTAARVLVELPENYLEVDPDQIASYAGLAPMDHSSGKYKGTARVGMGNPHLKGALFMGTQSLIARDAKVKAKYHRLRERGHAHQKAMVALMRHRMTLLIRVLQRGTPWQKEPPTP